MLRIVSPYQGQVLNHLQGVAGDDGLQVTVRGEASGVEAVSLNGEPVPVSVGAFQAPVVLRAGRNLLKAAAVGAFGRAEHELDVWYDPHRLKRYRFSVDDNSFWLREIGRNSDVYPSLFDCFYLKGWRHLHEEYGLQVVLNIYFETDDGFSLADFPERYRSEFADHAHWLKLAWHARSDKPDRPYEYAGCEAVAADYDRVANEVLRFAGEATLSPPTVVHWAEVTPAGMKALVEREVRNLSGIFRRRHHRQTGNYHLRDERADIVEACAQWIDAETGIAFSQADITANNAPLETIVPFLDALRERPEHAEIMDFFTHEQYFWDFYIRHVPDHFDRCEAMVRWATDHGYRPCWFHEGFLGGPDIR